MNEISKLLQEHDLHKELSENKEFIDKVKKIFYDCGFKCNESQIKEIIDNVCDELNNFGKLSEKDLNDVVGGVQTPEARKQSMGARIADIIIKTTTTVVGCAIGGATGAVLSSEVKFENRKIKNVTCKTFPTVAGVGTGSVLGYRLGKSISNKLGLS